MKCLSSTTLAVLTPRPPSADEQAKMEKVKALKALIDEHMGERKKIETKDMREILESMGGDTGDNLSTLEGALNSRDQG